ncbi:hypothetical protein ER308_00170 [Egibacter rhizosphaerae]|uniref:Uncharacterized protein n=1 Tax=Egibacter rhizosphaerae TaxID=1670831 RepID=A0A411YKX3_9ACTN|nr:hypothetical protein ER308_00170 [Egibacter rhizosphaerae]
MTAEFVRDAVATCAIFGFFGMVWFGWAHEAPPARLRRPLAAGLALSIVAVVVGGALTWRYWSDGTVFDEQTGPTYGIIVAIEFAIAAVGAVVLAIRDRQDLIPPWIAIIVGLHLFPLAMVLNYPMLHVVAALVTAAGLVAVPVARALQVAVSAVTGIAAGTVLLAAAAYSASTIAAI